MKLWLVGGSVRDFLLGRDLTKDFDFAVEAASYEEMRGGLIALGAVIHVEHPEYVTLRGRVNARTLGGDFATILRGRETVDADFTLCREESHYTDARHPDTVTPTTIWKDMMRRDFTINAVAVSPEGFWVDPSGGMLDARKPAWLRAVGVTGDRFREDPLRILRALRFRVTREVTLRFSLSEAIAANRDLLNTLPVERVRHELNLMLSADWRLTVQLIDMFDLYGVLGSFFPDLWLKATTEAR